MAEAVVNFAVQTIGNMLIEEAKFLQRVRDQVEDLQMELSILKSFLKEADAKKNDNEMIKVYVSQARDLAYQAEDLIERYAFRVASDQRKNILERFNECVVPHSIGSEIQKLISKISNLHKRFQDYGLTRGREGSTSSSSDQQLRRTYPHFVDADFVGLESEVEELVEHLVSESDGVISIQGMGGLGKTTLAKKVYNHEKIKRHFDGFAFVSISQQWNKRDILQGILINFIPGKRDEIQKWRDEELVEQLFETQQEKKCLVVLDDIWSTNAWNSIKDGFSISGNGSKILLTTRKREVALEIGPRGFHYEPRLLSTEESWQLLQMKALRGRHDIEEGDMKKMEQLGKQMVEHLWGLPLAVVVIGGILVTKRHLTEWENVCKNINANYLGRGKSVVEDEGEIFKILALSYSDLPHKLKPCFLYLGGFPEDSEIEVEMIYQLWIAEGFISEKDQIGDETVMDVAERYLEELAGRSMIQVDNKLIRTYRKYSWCRLHDLMRELSLKKAEEESFLFSIQLRNDEVYPFSSNTTNPIYRLFINFNGKKDDTSRYVLPPHVRSLLLFKTPYVIEGRMKQIIKSELSSSKMLRVLANFVLCKDVGYLIHLRYLSLKMSILQCLPSFIGNLQHLQTFDLRGTLLIEIPHILSKLRQLRYLYLPFFNGSVGSSKLRLDELSKLEILKGFNPNWCFVKDLSKLTNLCQLEAWNIQNDHNLKEVATFLLNSKKLHYTSLNVWLSDDLDSVIKDVFSCNNLHELSIRGPIREFPKYEDGFASDLVSLELWDTNISEDPMETLERLPKLQRLFLEPNSFVGTEMTCRADDSFKGFPELRVLSLMGLSNLGEWTIAKGAMPKLSVLFIQGRNILEIIPDGREFLKTLKELEVGDRSVEFKGRLQVDGQEREDFYKICHMPSIVMHSHNIYMFESQPGNYLRCMLS